MKSLSFFSLLLVSFVPLNAKEANADLSACCAPACSCPAENSCGDGCPATSLVNPATTAAGEAGERDDSCCTAAADCCVSGDEACSVCCGDACAECCGDDCSDCCVGDST